MTVVRPSSMRYVSSVRALLLASLVWLVGCGGGPAKSPESAANTFAGHVEKDEYDKAYALLSEDAKKLLSRQDFEHLLRQHPELKEEIVSVLRDGKVKPTITATITTKSGRVLRLVYENGEFRFDESAIEIYPRRTPKEAVESFVLALEKKRYDVLLEFIPKDQKDGLDARVLKTSFEGPQKAEIDHLKAALSGSFSAANVEILGERAVVSYGTDSRIDLVIEDGLWKIEDFK